MSVIVWLIHHAAPIFGGPRPITARWHQVAGTITPGPTRHGIATKDHDPADLFERYWSRARRILVVALLVLSNHSGLASISSSRDQAPRNVPRATGPKRSIRSAGESIGWIHLMWHRKRYG